VQIAFNINIVREKNGSGVECDR